MGFECGAHLQGVDVLGEAAAQEPLLVEQADEQVCRCGLELSGEQLFGQLVEWSWVLLEVVDVEDSRGFREIIFCQVVVKTGPRSAEVWNASRH